MEDLIIQSKEVISKPEEKIEEVKSTEKKVENKSKTKVAQITTVPRGKPKSGRTWKSEKNRFSSIVKTRGIRDKFEKKQSLRIELKRVKDASRAIIAAKKEQKEMQKQRRRDNLKRQEENRKKSEVVQVIKNPSKIKRMKKKQLRYIEKRDTTNM
ncbi:uncharacterized protein CBL_08933 [Carabus blaptoides fortunei]